MTDLLPDDGPNYVRSWTDEIVENVFHVLHPECPAYPGIPNPCSPLICDCFQGDNSGPSLAQQVEEILKFCLRVVRTSQRGNDVDGGDVHEWAVAAGLLHEVVAKEPCHPEDCVCAEVGKFPQGCYRLSPALMRLVADADA